jgi:hypothetical protein
MAKAASDYSKNPPPSIVKIAFESWQKRRGRYG